LASTRFSILAVLIALAGTACLPRLEPSVSRPDPAPSPGIANAPGPQSATPSPGCPAVTGTPWQPSIRGAYEANHDASVTVSRETYSAAGLITGLTQSVGKRREVTIRFPMNEDLGPTGSITLVAELEQWPRELRGGAHPMLVSLHDGVRDLVNVPRLSEDGECLKGGYFRCNNGATNCNLRPECEPKWPSAFADANQWLSRQLNLNGFVSVNTFPTCNWLEGEPKCAFNQEFFVGGTELYAAPGAMYTAKFLLMANQYLDVSTGHRARVRVTVVKKRSNAPTGAMDVNVILVGSKNVAASRTRKGATNLDALVEHLQRHYGQPNAGIRLGVVRAIEWGCEQGGDAYATIPSARLGELFRDGSANLPDDTDGRALNIFVVSSIESRRQGMTVLGMTGGVGGAVINGTAASGVALSSFNQLETLNPECPATGPCEPEQQEAGFHDMGATLSHEVGHFLGLNHLSEPMDAKHDWIPDTPACTSMQRRPGTDLLMLTAASCRLDTNVYEPTRRTCADVCADYDGVTKFCPEQAECEFNHVMWWTAKRFNPAIGSGDGTIFSPDSGVVLNYSPLVW
jgi:hypothetical protein